MYIFGTRGASGWKSRLKDFFFISVIDRRLGVVVIVGTPRDVGGGLLESSTAFCLGGWHKVDTQLNFDMGIMLIVSYLRTIAH